MTFIIASLVVIIVIGVVTQLPLFIFLMTALLGTYIIYGYRIGILAEIHMGGNYVKATEVYAKGMWGTLFCFTLAVSFSYGLSYFVNSQGTHMAVSLWWLVGAIALLVLKKPLSMFNLWAMKDLVKLFHAKKMK